MTKKLLVPFRAIARAYYRAVGYYPCEIFGERYKLDPYHIWLWRRVRSGRWEPETFSILERYLKPDTLYFDVGAWIGTTSVLYASTRCKRVICFEPDAEALRFLLWNIELNQRKNIEANQIALSSYTGSASMAPFHGTRGDSTSSLIHPQVAEATSRVLTLTWDDYLKQSQSPNPDFIKMDIEGGEFALLPAMKSYLDEQRPTLYLSTHAPYLQKADRLPAMQGLIEALSGYRICRNSAMEEISFDTLIQPTSLNRFCSFVFEK